MRELKFRAWDVGGLDRGKYIEWEKLRSQFDAALDDVDVTLEQYTGLRDRNGREIYENDIVRFVDYEGVPITDEKTYYDGPYWKVKYTPPSFGLYSKNGCPFDNGDFYRGDDINWKDVEVIGSTHETPDLLK